MFKWQHGDIGPLEAGEPWCHLEKLSVERIPRNKWMVPPRFTEGLADLSFSALGAEGYSPTASPVTGWGGETVNHRDLERITRRAKLRPY